MSYDAELILTEETMNKGKFEIPIDVIIKLTKQDIEHLRETKKLDYYSDIAIKVKLVCDKK